MKLRPVKVTITADSDLSRKEIKEGFIEGVKLDFDEENFKNAKVTVEIEK